MAFSRVLGVNIYLGCIDAGIASPRNCAQLPNNCLLLFVLKNINPDRIVHQVISNQIFPAYLKSRDITIAFLLNN